MKILCAIYYIKGFNKEFLECNVFTPRGLDISIPVFASIK